MKKDTAAVRSGLLPDLKSHVKTSGHLHKDAMSGLAAKSALPLNEVYGVSTFYSYLPVEPVGKNIIRVCRCVPCDMKDAPAVISGVTSVIGIAPGQTTADGKFSFELVNCIGACDQAPAMMINDQLYGNLTPAKIAEILRSF
jgi:NADH-quinone oxidoreductase subunit E